MVFLVYIIQPLEIKLCMNQNNAYIESYLDILLAGETADGNFEMLKNLRVYSFECILFGFRKRINLPYNVLSDEQGHSVVRLFFPIKEWSQTQSTIWISIKAHRQIKMTMYYEIENSTSESNNTSLLRKEVILNDKKVIWSRSKNDLNPVKIKFSKIKH